MSINVAAVVAQFGAYYVKGSDAEKTLRNMIYERSNTASLFQNRPTDDSVWRGTFASMSRVVQAFQKAFTPIGTLTFKPNKFDLFQMKVDVKEQPDVFAKTFLGFLEEIAEHDRSKWPFVRWFIETQILPKKTEDLEMTEYFKGQYVVPTANTPSNEGESMDGLRKVLRDYNTAARLNMGDGPVASGAAAADAVDFCLQIEEWVENLRPQFRNRFDKIIMSDTLARRYMRGKLKLYGKEVNFIDNTTKAGLITVENKPSISIAGVESMEGSSMWFATTADNRIRPIKKAKTGETLAAEQFSPREVSIWGDWYEALNFEVPEFVVTNDQDLA